MTLITFLTCFLALLGQYKAADDQILIFTRDNAALMTYFWYPDESQFPKPWNTVYEVTPYNAATDGSIAARFNSEGFAYVSQDMRGKFGSNGTYSFFRTSGNDTIDTIQWFNMNAEWATGQFAFHGISADCLGQYSGVMGVTQSGYWPDGNYQPYLDIFNQLLTGVCALGNMVGRQSEYQGGAYRQGLTNRWLAAIGEESMTVTIKENENWTPWWYDLDGQAFDQWDIVQAPYLNFGGWYDIFGQNQIYTVLRINATSVSSGQQILFMDPGGHCPSGDIFWPQGEQGWDYINNEIAPTVFHAIFEANANGQVFNMHDVLDFNVLFYMLGPDGENEQGNFWVKALSFPPVAQVQKWYFTSCGLFANSQQCGLNTTIQTNSGSVTYTYDPTDPVDTWGGNNLMIQPCGPWNQNRVDEDRSDVIYFQSSPFDTAWGLVGNLTVNLWVSSDSVDTDFVAKVTDVYPNGDSYLIQDSIIRMRWRNGYYTTEQAPNMQQGQVYNVQIWIGYMTWIFNPGHSLKVTITSSNNPRFSVNYNSGNWVNEGNTGEHPAENTIYFGGQYDSYLEVSVVDLDWVNQRKFDFDNIDKSHWWTKEESRKERGKMFNLDKEMMDEYMKQWNKVDQMAKQYYGTRN